MQEVPSDLLEHDRQTFPTVDPRDVEALKKAHQKALKEQAMADAAEAKARKKEREAVQRTKAMPVVEQKKKQSLDKAAATRARELKAHKIRLYFARLGHKIGLKEPKVLPRTDEELDELIAAIECELQSAGGIEQADTLFLNGCFGFEKLTEQFNPLGLMLSGPAASLTNTVAANKDAWHDIMTEFAIAHAEWFMIGPGKRAFVFLAQMVMTVDQANKVAIAQAHMRQTAPTDKEKEEAADL